MQFLIYISAMEVPELCAICKHPVDSGDHSASTLYPKGSLAINKASNSRKDTVPGEKVHKDCRRKYCNPDQIAKDTKQEESTPSTSSDRHVLRSSEGGFSFATDCFFCGRPAKLRRKSDVLQVNTIGLMDTLLTTCYERADSWSDTVKAQILHVHDLHAAEAVYHQTCGVNFRPGKQMPMAQLASTGV